MRRANSLVTGMFFENHTWQHMQLQVKSTFLVLAEFPTKNTEPPEEGALMCESVMPFQGCLFRFFVVLSFCRAHVFLPPGDHICCG